MKLNILYLKTSLNHNKFTWDSPARKWWQEKQVRCRILWRMTNSKGLYTGETRSM